MKKRSLGILVFCLLLFGLCGTAFAEEKNEKPLLHNGEPDGECGDGI